MLAKKAGMVVLGAAAGMVALTPAAFAGNAPAGSSSPISSGGGQSWGADRAGEHGQHAGQHAGHRGGNRDRHHGHRHGGQHGGQDHGRHHGHHPHSGGGQGASARNGDCVDGGNHLVNVSCTNVQAPTNQLGVASQYDNRGGGHGHGGNGASARNGSSANVGNSLVNVSGTNVQAPLNQPGVLSSYRNG